MELWAIARYDLGLSWEEFEELTPAMFRALCKRRSIRFKHERYAHALTASLIYNVNREKDAPALGPFDFVRDEASQRKKDELDKAKRFIRKAIGNLPPATTYEKLQEIRLKVIADVTAYGRDDAEQLFDACWPSLKPKKD